MSAQNQGFILTRQHRDTPSGIVFVYWLVTPSGPIKLQVPAQQAVFFIPADQGHKADQVLSQSGLRCRRSSVPLCTFGHAPTEALYFDRMSDYYSARDHLLAAGVACHEHDVKPTDRYLMERFIYGSCRFSGTRIDVPSRVLRRPISEIRQGQLAPGSWQPRFKVMSLDIECSGRGELFSVGLVQGRHQRVVMIGAPQADDDPEWIQWVENEQELLLALIEQLHVLDPDILIGWNIVNFDMKVLDQAARRCGVKLALGRDGTPMYWRAPRDDTLQAWVSIEGRKVVDGIDSLRTATYQFDSFALEHVAQALLGRGKLSDDVDNRLAAIEHDFVHNKRALAEYNLQDCVLVQDIFDHTRLLSFLTLRSQLTGLELDRSGGSVAAFLNLYLPNVHRAGYVAPMRPANGGLASPGGYVMSSHPGLYQHVLVLDFKSLYPSIIRTFCIDPVGLVEGLKCPEQGIPGFKDAVFSRTQHYLPDIITSLWQQRDEAKKAGDAPRSQAIKILMNSFYGVLGSGGCPFYDTRLASSITLRGHEIMQTTARWIEQAGYKVIYGDTDSTFVCLDGEQDLQSATAIGRRLQDDINARWQANIRDEYGLECHLEIEFETYFSPFLMPTIRGSEQGSKKRYAGRRQRPEGQDLVFKGLESVRSDWTALAKGFQQTLFEKVFNQQDVQHYIQDMLLQTRNGQWDDLLVYRKRLRQGLENYHKNVPPHVRAALHANEQRARQGKSPKYQGRGWVEYVITTQGPQAVDSISAPIDYQHYIDKQLKPIADGILPFIGLDFSRLSDDQMSLF
ncbi:DNA polymerase II [Aestuariibacter halophilus]|uniref:DNA polymerase n=1 Tax=Fluctibacter halophilus TaxID=226011 RepID=A0ABS8G9N3_9ALTE|nr:DNA polymerase II [Aestuariibacter halophilus]MCC2617275.1 DNA polymerase II [Aestuariibacter halophilus]